MGNSAPAATTAEVEQEGRYHQQQQSDRQDEDDHDRDEEEDGSGGDDDDDDVLPSTINLSNLSLDSPPPFRFSASLSLPLRRVLLLALQHTARASLPLSGLSPDDESSLQPTASERRYGTEAGGWFSDSDAVNSFMQDEWLYGEEERRQMLRDGVIDAFWCDACRRTIRHVQEEKEEEEEEEEGAQAAPSSAPLPLPQRCPHCLSSAAHVHRRSHITHSVSQAHLSLLFSSFLPRHIAHLSHPSFSVVDVGSRIGNVLFSALLLADVGRVVGVEKDSQMTALCSRLAQHYGLQDTGHRLQVLQGSVETAGAEAVAAADLLFFFNPFELHCDREEQRRLLRWLRQAFRKREGDQWKGQWLLSVPDMEAIYERAGSEVDVSAWLRRLADCRDAALYAVIG